MTKEEVVNIANQGNAEACYSLGNHEIENEEWDEALEWHRKGAQLGHVGCMAQASHLLVMLAFAGIAVTGGSVAKRCLSEFEEAEKWAIEANSSGTLKESIDLTRIYAGKMNCFYLLACSSKDDTYYNKVIHQYSIIKEKGTLNNVTPKDEFFYCASLAEMRQYDKFVPHAERLMQNHSNALGGAHQILLSTNLFRCYFEGRGVAANYDKACKYGKILARLGNNAEMLKSLESGALRKDFEKMHSKSDSSTKQGGCYIATAVYGSYDCPEVWTLRRYRDTVLSSTWYGRLFIKVYYAVSPTVVKMFGNTTWFNYFWRDWLDKKVKLLQESGVEATRYYD